MQSIIKSCILLSIILFAHALSAQTFSVRGRCVDTTGGARAFIQSVNIVVYNESDTSKKYPAVSAQGGVFQITGIPSGSYRLEASFIGYDTRIKYFKVENDDAIVGPVIMKRETEQLAGVKIKGQGPAATQKDDTTVFNAAAFKTNPDATAEDLVNKMPGITTENGKLKAQGEEVKKVTVDGQEFFGDDAAIALKNLPADVVDKVQVYDRMSDQAQFTGFNDGNTDKTINIITKSGKSNGQFGKLYAGYGTDDRYMAGGNINMFKGARKLSILGLSNNINQQNFTSQDLLGVTAASGGGGGRMYGGGGPMGGGGSTNFLVGQQGGINTANSYGLNYSNKFGDKLNLSGSYFLNKTSNSTGGSTNRLYFLQNGSTQNYSENKTSDSRNMNHRFSLRLDYTIDTSNSILVTPRFNFQNNDASSLTYARTLLGDTGLLNTTLNNNTSDNSGYSFSNMILFRHKFRKARRTVSLSINSDINDKSGSSLQYSRTERFNTLDSITIYDQRGTSESNGTTHSANLFYTEPIGKNSMLQLNYSPSYAKNNSERITRYIDNATNEYSVVDSTLSSKFDNTVITQRAGLNYRYSMEKINFAIGASYQNVELNSDQTFPNPYKVRKPFNNILPNGMLRFSFSRTNSLRIFYRASTNVPNITQLQTVVNNSNPVLLSTGNPDLKQEYTHGLFSRYNFTVPSKAKNLSVFVAGSYTTNYIASSTVIAKTDSVLQDGIVLYKGSQLSRPVNLDGYWNLRTSGSYGMPIKALKSNLNITAGMVYSRVPGSINGAINMANTYNMNSGFALGSNISDKVDFKISYAANYNIVQNSIQPQLNNNYFYHNSSLKFNLMPWKGLVINTDMNHTQYIGLGNFNQSFLLLNAGLGYKFLKNRAGELKIFTFDLLNQNNSVSRTVTETYIEDNNTKVLRRYFMLSFVYTFRHYKMPSKNK